MREHRTPDLKVGPTIARPTIDGPTILRVSDVKVGPTILQGAGR
jgi:hypothetical protein